MKKVDPAKVSCCNKCLVPLDILHPPKCKKNSENAENEEPTGPPAVRKKTPKGSASKPKGIHAQYFETSARLNEILTGRVDLDDPLCQNCCDTLIATVDGSIAETEDWVSTELLNVACMRVDCHVFHRDTLTWYTLILFQVRDQKVCLVDLDEKNGEDEETFDELEAELAQLHVTEGDMDGEIKKLQTERTHVFRERDLWTNAVKRLEKEHEKESREYMKVKEDWFAASDEYNSVANQLAYAKGRLDALNKTDAFKEHFRIDCRGPIAWINGSRLGKLPEGLRKRPEIDGKPGKPGSRPKPPVKPVAWSEINIAWGEVVFTLDFCVRILKIELAKYNVVPFGSHSRIEVLLPEPSSFQLYLSEGFEPEDLASFNTAQTAFLDCLKQVEREIKGRDGSFTLYHPITEDHGRIHSVNFENSFSIRYSGTNILGWNNALRCMLENLRQILTFTLDVIRKEKELGKKKLGK